MNEWYSENLDEIQALQDPSLFNSKIEAEIASRTLSSDREVLKRDPDYVASVVASRCVRTMLWMLTCRLSTVYP